MLKVWRNSPKILAVVSVLAVAATGLLQVSPARAAGGGGGGGDEALLRGCYYDLPQITANLRPVDGFPHFMSLNLSVCLSDDQAAQYLASIEPRILDSVQPYIRDIRLEELHGAEGMYRLRHNLLARIRAAAWPVEVEAVVFREILVD
jgi:flagellar FliL protein